MPADPERIVVLDDTQMIGGLAALGIVPAGVRGADLHGWRAAERPVRISGREVTWVGAYDTTDLERIAELAPT